MTDNFENKVAVDGPVVNEGEGRTPMQTLEEGKAIWREKFVAGT